MLMHRRQRLIIAFGIAFAALLLCKGQFSPWTSQETGRTLNTQHVQNKLMLDTPPNVAICLVGLARSFVNPKVYLAMRRNLIEALNANVSVFMYIAKDDAPRTGTRPQDRGVVDSNLEEALNTTRPVRVAYRDLEEERRSGYDQNHSQILINNCPKHFSTLTYFAMARTINFCAGMVNNYTAETGVKFDWFIRSRPDVTFLDPVWPADHFPKDRIVLPGDHPHMDDHFHVMPFSWMDKYAAMGDIVNYDCKLIFPEPTKGYENEILFSKWFQLNHMDVMKVHIFWVLVRSVEGAECRRRPKPYELQRCLEYFNTT